MITMGDILMTNAIRIIYSDLNYKTITGFDLRNLTNKIVLW